MKENPTSANPGSSDKKVDAPTKPNKHTLTIIVSGTPTQVEVNRNVPLHTVIPRALEQTGHAGQPPENWELRDAQGGSLDLSKKIEDHQFSDGVKLFLSLKAGTGG